MDPAGECQLCGAGADCEAGSTLETMTIKQSSWRASNRSKQVLACPVPEACLGSGSADATEEGCLEGNTGVLCGQTQHTRGHARTKAHRHSQTQTM